MYSNNSKPKILVRNLHDVILDWEETIFDGNNESPQFQLQMCDDLKEWKTIYRGKKTRYKIDCLATCTCYSFRIRLEPQSEWIYFKAATADDGPYSLVMHMSRAVRLGKAPLIRKMANTRCNSQNYRVLKRAHLLEAENKENKTPLIQAIEVGDPQIVQLLITLGANVNTPLSYNKRTPLMMAVYKNQLQIANILIDKGANLYAKDVNGLNVLHHAVDSNNIKNVEFVLQTGVDINSKDNSGWTPLLRAAILNITPEIVKLLLKNGADKNIQDKNNMDYDKHRALNNPIKDVTSKYKVIEDLNIFE